MHNGGWGDSCDHTKSLFLNRCRLCEKRFGVLPTSPEEDHQNKPYTAVSMPPSNEAAMAILGLHVTHVSAVMSFCFISAPAGFLENLWLCAVPLLGECFC
jgi:hypothetical protein